MLGPKSRLRQGSYVLLTLGILITVAIVASAAPIGFCFWAICPYLCVMLLDLAFHRGGERVAILLVSLLAVSFGVLANADGLVFHWGLLVENDPDVSHLVTLFAPLHQFAFLLLAAAGFAIVRLILFIKHRFHATPLV